MLRDLDAYVSAGLAGVNVFLTGPSGQAIWWHFWTGLSEATAQWGGRQVMNTGETFGINTDGAADVTISGYLLSLP